MATPPAPPITVTAFGKHPAWADHIDNLPSPGPRIPQFKSLIYTNGIDPNVRRWTRKRGRNSGDDVDSPALDSDQADAGSGLIRFNHRMRWWTPDALILGTLTPSADLKERKKYPLVITAQFVGVDPEWVRGRAWPILESLSTNCQQADSTDAVRAVLEEATEQLGSEFADWDRDASTADQSGPVPENDAAIRSLAKYFAGSNEATPAPRQPPIELIRIVYQINRVTQASPQPENWPGAHLRLPVLTADSLYDMTLYQNAARHLTGGRVPVLAVMPIGENWIDLVIGSPDPSQFRFLRRSDLAISTEVAFNLSEQETDRIRAIIRDGTVQPIKEQPGGLFKRNPERARPETKPEPVPEPPTAPPAPTGRPPTQIVVTPKKRGGDDGIKIMLLAIGALAMLLLALIIILFQFL